MTDSPIQADPSAPVFFLSYARPSYRSGQATVPSPDTHLNAFYDLLSWHVSELLGSLAGEYPGYVDLRRLEGGEVWDSELAWATGSCSVFVPLLSKRYFESEWCRRELAAFSRRTVIQKHPGGSHTGILPVLWTPISREMQTPPALSRIHRFTPTGMHDPDISRRYERNGLYGLLSSFDKEAYSAVIWCLAQRIGDVCGECQVEPSALPESVAQRTLLVEDEGA